MLSVWAGCVACFGTDGGSGNAVRHVFCIRAMQRTCAPRICFCVTATGRDVGKVCVCAQKKKGGFNGLGSGNFAQGASCSVLTHVKVGILKSQRTCVPCIRGCVIAIGPDVGKARVAYKGRHVAFLDGELLCCTWGELKCLGFAEL